jgi:hypothetical protein
MIAAPPQAVAVATGLAPEDRRAAILACISGCCAAYGVYFGLPLILAAVGHDFGFDERQLGWAGSADNLGLLVGSVAVSLSARQVRFRLLAFVGISVAVLGDLLTPAASSYPVFIGLRLLAGTGNGMCYSASVALLSLSSKPTRNFAALVIILVVINSVELWVLPFVVTQFGVTGLYRGLAAAFAVPAVLFFICGRELGGAIGAAPIPMARAAPDSHHLTVRLGWLCLASVILFNVSASAFWAYAERIGSAAGITEDAIANTLTVCNLLSLGGSALAYVLSRRFGQYRPLLVATGVVVGVFLWWASILTPGSYVGGVFLFFEVWAMAAVLQLGILSGIDGSGRLVALFPAAQGVGQSAGPFVAGAMLGWGAINAQILAMSAGFAVLSGLACLRVYTVLRREAPALASS